MRIQVLQHVAFEGPAFIADWAARRGHPLAVTRLQAAAPLPALQDFEMLVILGGPMNIYEHERFPWLTQEKIFIRRAIDAGKPVLGICLGAQLIADVLGGRVTRNPLKEIGWFPVRLTREAATSRFFEDFPAEFPVFQWHGDTFAVPPGAALLAESDACRHQAFDYEGRVLALQFHLESTPESIRLLTENCAADIEPGPHVQSPTEFLSNAKTLSQANAFMARLLERFETALAHAR